MVHTTVPGYVASSHKDMGRQALLASTVLKLQQKNEQKKPTKKKKTHNTLAAPNWQTQQARRAFHRGASLPVCCLWEISFKL